MNRSDQSKAQIRRRLLTIARIDGSRYDDRFVPAANFFRARDDNGEGIDGDGEAQQLLADLVEWGLLAEASGMDLGGAAVQFRHCRFRLTKKGQSLWQQEIPPIPGVADERFGDA